MSPVGTQKSSKGSEKVPDAKEERVSVRVSPAIKAALEVAARDDERNVSRYVEKVLKDHLVSKGLLP